MPVRYLVRAKNHVGAKVAEFAGRGRRGLTPGGLQSATYRKRLRTPGSFTLYIQGDDNRLEGLELDYQFEFWRSDPFITRGHIATLPYWMRDASIPDWYKDFEGFLRVPPEWAQMADGTYQAILRGRGYNDLTQAEPIIWPKGSSQSAKSGVAETVAKSYADQNIGPGAGLDEAGNTRVRPGLTIEASAGTGATWPGGGEVGERHGKQLSDVLKELAEFGPGDFMIIGTGAATYLFMWRYPYWGNDKTVGNASGNAPILLSSRTGTLTNVVSSGDYLNDINVIHVFGQGSGSLLKVKAVAGSNLTLSPWARRAVIESVRDNVADNDMVAFGTGILEEVQTKTKVSGDYVQARTMRYGPDPAGSQGFWDYGDVVSVEADRTNTMISKRVVGVTVGISSGSEGLVESIEPELEEPYAV